MKYIILLLLSITTAQAYEVKTMTRSQCLDIQKDLDKERLNNFTFDSIERTFVPNTYKINGKVIITNCYYGGDYKNTKIEIYERWEYEELLKKSREEYKDRQQQEKNHRLERLNSKLGI